MTGFGYAQETSHVAEVPYWTVDDGGRMRGGRVCGEGEGEGKSGVLDVIFSMTPVDCSPGSVHLLPLIARDVRPLHIEDDDMVCSRYSGSYLQFSFDEAAGQE